MNDIHVLALVTLDRPEFTRKTWEALLDKERWGIDPERVRVIWRDNGSNEANLALFTQWAQDFGILDRTYGWKNFGIAHAINRMLRVGFEHYGAEYVTTVANDIIEPEGWLAIRERGMDTVGNPGICSIKVSDAATVNSSVNFDLLGISAEFSHLISGNHTICRKAWETVGYYNEEFGIYAPIDFDYCARLNAFGFATFQINNVRAEHLGTHGKNDKDYQAMKDAAHNAAASKVAAAMQGYTIGRGIYYKPRWIE